MALDNQDPRTLNVLYDGWLTSRVHILDANENPLYTAKIQLRKPHMTVESASTGATIGTVTFHSLTNRIDNTVHSSEFSLNPRSFLKNRHTYSSPALGGAEMTWKMKTHNLDLVCTDDRGIAVARFCFSNWSLKKCGKFEIVAEVNGEDAVEEILVTGLALVEAALALRGSVSVA